MYFVITGSILGGLIVAGFLFFQFKELGYNYMETRAIKTDLPKQVADVCQKQSGFYNQVECVKNYYYTDFNYVDHYAIRMPSEMIQKGGVCRDYAVALCSTYRLMGFRCNYARSIVDHVFVTVGNDLEYCMVNWNQMDCNIM